MKINEVVVMYLNDDQVSQLLVQGMLACVRSRTRIEVLRSKSRGARLYAYQADLLDRRPICCHNIIRDSIIGGITTRGLPRL
jgi:hypothetical protein